MRIGIKFAVSVALILMAALTLAACGGSGGSGSTAGSTSATGSDTELSGTVEVWDGEYKIYPEYTKAVDQIDAEFEKLHPKVTVKREAVPSQEQYKTAVTAHEGPDVFVLQPGVTGVLTYEKSLEPLNSLITPEMDEELGQWSSVTPGLKEEGNRYGVPIGVTGFVIYYNKKLFKQAGLPAEFEPETWAEVREAGEKLEAAGIQPFTGGNKDGLENIWWFTMGFHSKNTPEEVSELATGELPWTSEAVAEAFEPMIEMNEAGLFDSEFYSTPWYPNGYVPFNEGKAGMIFGLWSTAGYYGEMNPKLGERNVGLFFPPETSSVEAIANISYSIPTFAKNKEAAWALLEYTASKKGAEVLTTVGGQLPFRKDSPIPADAPVQEKKLLDAYQNGETVLSALSAVGLPAHEAIEKEISQVLQGRTSLADAQKVMQEGEERAAR